MSKFLSKNNKATIAGYATAIFNAIMVLDVDTLNWHLPSTYLKLFGAIVLPIIGGHMTQLKGNENQL
jgi:hypothetical protein